MVLLSNNIKCKERCGYGIVDNFWKNCKLGWGGELISCLVFVVLLRIDKILVWVVKFIDFRLEILFF